MPASKPPRRIQADPYRALAIFECYLEHQNFQTVADELRISLTAVRGLLVGLGVIPRRSGRPTASMTSVQQLNSVAKLEQIRQQLRRHVADARIATPDDYRQTLELFLEHQDLGQVAQALSIPLSEAAWRLTQLRVKWHAVGQGRSVTEVNDPSMLEWLLYKLKTDPLVVMRLVSMPHRRPRRRPRSLTAQQAYEAFTLYLQLQSGLAVAEQLQLPRTTLIPWLRSLGLVTPAPGGKSCRPLEDWNPPGRLESIAAHLRQEAEAETAAPDDPSA